MLTNDVLLDGFQRVHDVVLSTVQGLSREQLAYRPGDQANSIAWLVWHAARIQDDHMAQAAGTDQLWTKDGWYGTFDPPSMLLKPAMVTPSSI